MNEHLITSLATGEEERTTRLTYRDTFLKLADLSVCESQFAGEIAGSAGLRNVLVHEYNDVDHTVVHASIRKTLEQYADYVVAVRGFLSERESLAED